MTPRRLQPRTKKYPTIAAQSPTPAMTVTTPTVRRPRRAVRRPPVTFINRRGIRGTTTVAVAGTVARSMATVDRKKHSRADRLNFSDFCAPAGVDVGRNPARHCQKLSTGRVTA